MAESHSSTLSSYSSEDSGSSEGDDSEGDDFEGDDSEVDDSEGGESVRGESEGNKPAEGDESPDDLEIDVDNMESTNPEGNKGM